MNKYYILYFTTDGTSALLYRVQEGSTSHQHDDKRFRQALLPYQARSATRYHVYHHQQRETLPLIISEMQPSCGCIILE